MSAARSIRGWLSELGLPAYADAFERNDIDFDIAPDLTDQDLQDLGVTSLGHRRRLLRAFAALGTTAPGDDGIGPPSSSGAAVTPAPADGAAAAGLQGEAERRQLTVLFCDLVDSTALSGRLDPENYRTLIRAYQEACSAVIERYDGYVARFMGDGVLAYFGWPRGHEDDAERAIRAGLEMIHAVSAIAPPEPESGRPRVRVGIATGPTIVGDIIGTGAAREATAIGMTPNLAARLQQVAAPDSVVIADSTRDLVRDLFAYETLGAQTFKGVDRPVSTWRVVGTGSTGTRFEARRGSAPVRPIGREHELSLLREQWERAVGGEGSVTLLAGEPGIGKSHLSEALVRALPPGGSVLARLQCSPYDATSALQPVIGHFERHLGLLREEAPASRLGRLEDALRAAGKADAENLALLGAMFGLAASGAGGAGLSPQRAKHLTLDLLATLLVEDPRGRPVLIVWEDVHWIDPSSLELLEQVVLRVAARRTMVLATHRPEWQAPFLSQPHVVQMQLARLGRRQIADMVRAVAARDVPADVLDSIVRRTDGIPLFVEEVTRLVAGADGEATAEGATDIPDTLQASLTARLDRLSRPARHAAQVAAAIGREVSLPLLREVLAAPPDDVDRRVEELIRSQLMVEGPAQQILFRHALIRDAAYLSLLSAQRRDIHRRIAAGLSTSFPQTLDLQPELVARHHAEAGDPVAAVALWRRAGQRAARLMASREAVEHYTNALAQLAKTPGDALRERQELQISLDLGPPLIAATGYASGEVRRTYERARGLAERLGDRDCLFTATRGLWNCIYDQGEVDRALELAVELNRIAGSDPDRQALALRALGTTSINTGALDDAVAAFERCIAIQGGRAPSTVGDQVEAPAIVARQYKGFVRCLQGRPAEGLALHEAAIEEARALDHPLALAFAMHLRAASALVVRDYDLCRRSSLQTMEIAAEHDLVFWTAGSRITLGCATAALGGDRSDLETAITGLRAWRETAAVLHVPLWAGLIAEAALGLGEVDHATAQVAEAISLARANHDVVFLAELHRLNARLATRRGDLPGARAELETACQIAATQGTRLFALRAAVALAELATLEGRAADGYPALRGALGAFEDAETFVELDEARSLLRA